MLGNPRTLVFFEFDPDNNGNLKHPEEYLQITMLNAIGDIGKVGPRQKVIRLNEIYQQELYELLKSKFAIKEH